MSLNCSVNYAISSKTFLQVKENPHSCECLWCYDSPGSLQAHEIPEYVSKYLRESDVLGKTYFHIISFQSVPGGHLGLRSGHQMHHFFSRTKVLGISMMRHWYSFKEWGIKWNQLKGSEMNMPLPSWVIILRSSVTWVRWRRIWWTCYIQMVELFC